MYAQFEKARAWLQSTAAHFREQVEACIQQELEGNVATLCRWLFLLALLYVSLFDVGAVSRAGASAGHAWEHLGSWMHSPRAEKPTHVHRDVFIVRKPELMVATPFQGDSRWTTESINVRIIVRNVNPLEEATHRTPRVCMRVVSSERTTFTIFSGCYFAMKYVREGEGST